MALEGKLLYVGINGSRLRCQTTANMSITQDVTDSEPCKPTEADTTNGSNWADPEPGQKSWTITATAQSFADVAAGEIDNSDVMELMITGNSVVEVAFATTKTTDYAHASTLLFEGTGILTNFSMTGEFEGNSTYDIEITGKGAPTFVKTPVVVTP